MTAARRTQMFETLTRLLGRTNVITNADKLSAAQTATFKTTPKIIGIVKAHDIEDVQKIVRIATDYQTPLYTVSVGKNWGFGSRVPLQDGSLLLDLSGMNQILEYDEELGYVTLEPGVTQKQLYNFLEANGGRFAPGTTGSAPNTSIIGNLCERGIGSPPYSFRSYYVSNLEAILPSGECVHTGYGRFSNAQATQVFRDGVGPSFIDMFIQSNLGIITKLTLLLAPKPTYIQFIDIYVPSEQELEPFLRAIRTFNLFSRSKKPIIFHSDLQVLASKTQYPWDLMNGKTPLSAELAQQLKKKYKLSYAWGGTIVLDGFTKQEVTAQLAYFKSLTKGFKGLEISPVYRPHEVVESNAPRNINAGIYWRMKTKPPRSKNPDTDGCGNIRIPVVVPFTFRHISEAAETMRQLITQHGYEPFLEIHCHADRWVLVVMSLVFDRTTDGEDEKALQCHDAVLAALMDKGYYPYRLNIHAMPLLPPSTDAYDDLQTTIKRAIDPHGIFSPGRYETKHN